jgi:RNA polymerase sigma-70 factor (ECF subfamily)
MADIPPTRASLLVRLREPHDQDAWREFIDLYVPLIYRYARKQGLQDADAADLSQEVLRAVAAAVGRLEYDPSRGAFRNWLFTIVRRKLSNWRRAQRNRLEGRDHCAAPALDQLSTSAEGEAAWELEWENGLFVWACEQVRRSVSDGTWQAFWRTAVDGQPSKRRVLARLKELVRSAQEP